MLRYVRRHGRRGWASPRWRYRGKWNSTDQVPQRAVDDGLDRPLRLARRQRRRQVQRYSLSVDWQQPLAGGRFRANAYAISYGLDLFSNFTYFLDDPVNGDQFEQADDRSVFGVDRQLGLDGRRSAASPTASPSGCELRQDRIGKVGLYSTRRARARWRRRGRTG